jgi:hypothetical protein
MLDASAAARQNSQQIAERTRARYSRPTSPAGAIQTKPCRKSIMKIFASLLATGLFALAIAPAVHSQGSAADSSAVSAKLKEMEDAWVKAIVSKDTATLGNFIADDFAGFDPDGKHVSKSQLLDGYKSDPSTLSSSTNENMDVHVYGSKRG